ncbi:hypothetical protein Hanom_Chr03g00270541 [Helianthus anomalus]
MASWFEAEISSATTILNVNYYLLPVCSLFIGKITSFVLYLYTTFQAVFFSMNFDKFCPL